MEWAITVSSFAFSIPPCKNTLLCNSTLN